jgi:GT2 family glycosyltransferase
MDDIRPQVSVVIPTHNRSAYLQNVLAGLRAQTIPLDRIELVVVADSCTDDTVAMLHRERLPFRLRVLERSVRSAAAARNEGAADAEGELLVFLDDDVHPLPELLAAHARLHPPGTRRAVIGPYPPFPDGASDLLGRHIRGWWEQLFREMGEPGHRFTYRDMVSGNFSLPAAVFREVGGFDPQMSGCGNEDYELGVRLLGAGVEFVFAADALAHHHETTDLDRFLRRKRHEGRSDVLLGRLHPQLRRSLPLARRREPLRSSWRSRARLLAFRSPRSGDALSAALRPLLPMLEGRGLHRAWHGLRLRLQTYWYWRGVADALGSDAALEAFLDEPARVGAGSTDDA